MTKPKPSPSEIRTELNRYIRHEILRKPEYALDNDTPLISGGVIDSFSITHISVFMEKAFSVHIRDADLTVENMDTVNAMASLVESALSGEKETS